MKKIILYTPTLHPGGVLNSNKLLAKGFKEKGYEVLIVANRKSENKIEGFRHIYLNAGDIVRPFKLKKIIEEEKPIAVFSSLQTQNITLALTKTLLGEKAKGTKFFGFIRTTDAQIKYGSKLHLPYRLFVKKMYEKLDKIIAVSSASKEDVKRTFFLRENVLTVISNPVDLSTLPSVSEKEKRIIYVGRLDKGKNVEDIIEIYFKLNIPDLKLFIVGDGKYKGLLKSKANNDENIIFTGYVNNPLNLIAKSKILLLTSSDEGFPRVVVEAFACGTPVVAYVNEFSGHRDIIDDGVNGFLVPFKDKNAFVEKVNLLLTNEELYTKFSIEARKKAREFSLDKIISKLENLIYEGG